MFDRNETIGDFIDAIVIQELKYAADQHNHYSMCKADEKLNAKVAKKARWLLKNWYMHKEEWRAYNV